MSNPPVLVGLALSIWCSDTQACSKLIALPAERILARYPRTLTNLTQAVRLADAAVLYDSHDVTPGTHTAVALCKGTWTKELVQPLPHWAQQILWNEIGP